MLNNKDKNDLDYFNKGNILIRWGKICYNEAEIHIKGDSRDRII